jgi:hypothetical protein
LALVKSTAASSAAVVTLLNWTNTFKQVGPRASCCRYVFCFSELTQIKPMSAAATAFRSSNVVREAGEHHQKTDGQMNA